MRRTLAVAFLVALAGCVGDDASGGAAADDSADGVAAPTWAVGDFWTFSNTDAAGNQSMMSVVVTGEAGGDWIVDTNEPTVALYHAREAISYLGQVRKSDLAGSQGGDRVQYFDFPLTPNKTWTTSWDGLPVRLEVVHVYDDGRVHIEATSGGRPFADYEYSSQKRFFGYIDFYDNGTRAYRMETSDHGSGFSGTVYRYQVGEPIVHGAADVGTGSRTLELADGVNELWFHSVADCADSPAGRIGSTVTTRGPDEPFVPQVVVGTRDPVHSLAIDCAPGVVAAATDVVAVDPDVVYDVEYGTAARGGTVTVLVEPRVLEAIAVG